MLLKSCPLPISKSMFTLMIFFNDSTSEVSLVMFGSTPMLYRFVLQLCMISERVLENPFSKPYAFELLILFGVYFRQNSFCTDKRNPKLLLEDKKRMRYCSCARNHRMLHHVGMELRSYEFTYTLCCKPSVSSDKHIKYSDSP